MKMWMKRGLSLLLAVVMTLSLLPVSALAARNTEQAETPVLDGAQGDVQRRGDGETPEKPVGPDDPADELLIADDIVDSANVSTNASGTGALITVPFKNLTGGSAFTVAVVPNFRLGDEGDQTPAQTALGDAATWFNVAEDLANYWSAFTDMYNLAVIPHDKEEQYRDKTFVLNWDGTMSLGGTAVTMIGTSQAGAISQVTPSALAEWYSNNTLALYAANGTKLENPTTLPYTVVLMFGDNSVYSTDIDIPITTIPLTVQITPKEATGNAMTEFIEDPYKYAEVKITNNTDEDMEDVVLHLYRKNVVDARPANFAAETLDDATDDSAETVDINGPIEDNTVSELYTLVDADALAGSLDSDAADMETVTIPAHSSVTLYIVGLDEDVYTMWNMESEYDDEPNTEWWSNYTVTATTSDDEYSAYDNAGIYWSGKTYLPKIQLVDYVTEEAIGVYGTTIAGTGSYPHKVEVLTDTGWQGLDYQTTGEDEGYYTLDIEVNGGASIRVDGNNVGETVNADEVPVKMCKLELEDRPLNAAGGRLGSFIVLDGNRRSFGYYRPNSSVYVFAKKEAHTGWEDTTGATPADSSASFTEILSTDKLVTTAMSTNKKITAIYDLVTIRILTTFNGSTQSIDHVHKLELTGTKGTVSATQPAGWTDGDDFDKVGTITQQIAGVNPWVLVVPGGASYALNINGVKWGDIDPNSLPTVAEGEPHYTIELAGVTPQVEGAEDAGTTLYLPDDLNPNRARGRISVTKDTNDSAPILYYPVDKNIPNVLVEADGDDVLTEITYPDGQSQTAVASPTIAVKSGANNTLTAKFKQKLEIWTYVNGVTSAVIGANDVVLKPQGGGTDIILEKTGYIYTTPDATPLDSSKTYDIYVNGIPTGLTSKSTKVTEEVGDEEHNVIKVPLQQVIIAHDPSSVSETTASSFSGGKYTNETNGGYIPNGAEITLNHGIADGWGNATPPWTASLTGSGAGAGTLTYDATGNGTYKAKADTSGTNVGAQTLTAKYVASTGQVKVQFYLNNSQDNTPVGSNTVYMSNGTGGTKVAASSSTTNGEYTWDDVGTGNYYIWVGTTRVYGPIVLATAGDSSLVNPIKYWEVKFDLKGCPGTTPTTQTVLDNTAAAYPGDLSWTGYIFDGWFDDATSATAEQWVGTVENKVTEQQTWYARRTANSHTITYAPGVATGATISAANQTQNVSYDDTNVAVRASTIITGTNVGWNFVNWRDADGNTYAGDGTGTVARITKSLTLTAQWTMDIQFDRNLPSGETTSTSTPTTQKIAKGGTLTSVPTLNNTTNYRFLGWRTSGGTVVNVTGTTTFDEPDTLYAVWAPEQYTINFYRNYNSTDTTLVDSWSRDYDTQLGTLPAPTRTDYTFGDWWPDGTAETAGTKIETTTKVTGPANYYAHWTRKTDTVVINTVKDAALVHNLSADTVVYLTPSGATNTSGAVASGTISAGTNTVTINNVPMDSANAYDIWLGTTKTAHTVLVDDDNATESENIQFYTLTLAKANSHGYVDFATSAPAADGATLSRVELPNTVVNIAANPAPNYSFGRWDGGTAGNFGTGAGTAVQTYKITTTTTLEAQFTKSAYNTYLYLTVNGTVCDTTKVSASATAVTDTVKIKSVELVRGTSGANATTPAKKADGTTNVAVSYDGTKTLWAAEGVGGSESPYWKITTADGGVYYKAANKDDNGNDVAPVLGATAADDKAVAREPLFGVTVEDGDGGNATSGTSNRATLAGVKRVVIPVGTEGAKAIAANQKNGFDLVQWNAGNATNPSAILGAQGSIVSNNFQLAASYTSPIDTDLFLKPVYTYRVPVNLYYKTVGASNRVGGQTVTIQKVDASDTASVTVSAGANAGEFVISGMTPGKTYEVWVNGYLSKVVLADTMASTTTAQNIILFKVSAKADVAAGTATVNSQAQVYVPQDATITGINANKGTLTGVGTSYRWLVPADGETLWTIDATDGASIADITNAETGVITTKTGAKVTGDIVAIAHTKVLRQVTKATEGVLTSDSPQSSVAFTTTGITGNTATLDDGSIIGVRATASANQELTGWELTGGDGNLYRNPACTDVITPTAAGVYNGVTDNPVYVKATANATVTAVFGDRHYDVTVQVNLDNSGFARTGGVEVKLYQTGTNNVRATAKADPTTGLATFSVVGGTYDVYADGATAGTAEQSDEQVTVNSGKTTDSATVNYYTVQLKADPEGPTGKKNTVKFDGQTTYAEKIVMAKNGAKVTVVATPFPGTATGETVHYRFEKWKTEDTTMGGTWGTSGTTTKEYTLPAVATLETKTTPIVLTAEFVQQYKVEVKLADTSLANASVSIRVEGASSWSTGSILVDDDKRAEIRLTETDDKLIFGKWTIDSGKGTFANGSGPASPTLGVEAQDFFAPDADSVLLAHLWQIGELKAGWQYDPTEKTGVMGTAQVPVKELQWIKNSGSDPVLLDGVKVEKKGDKADYSDATPVSLSAGDLVQDETNKTKYTFRDEFVNGLTNGTYRVTFTYKLGEDGNKNQIATQTVDTEFYILSTKVKLKQVNIQVEDGTCQQTANVVAATNRDDVNYKDHTAVKTNGTAGTIAQEDLTFTWYYTKTKPGNIQKDYATEALANAARPAGWVAIGTATSWASGGNTINVVGNTTLEAGYIFAVVTASGERSEGAVITNVIPVDYTAKIVVNEDDKVIDAAGSYKVYLWPTDATGTFSTSSSSAIQASWNGTSKKFEATATGDKSYYIYATTVEGGTAYQRVGNLTIAGDAQEKEIKYYTVNALVTDEKHVMVGTDSLGQDLTGKPTTVFEVKGGAANGENVDPGTAVLSGTKITASASKTWNRDTDYDYKWNWGSVVDNVANGIMATPPTVASSYGTEGLASGSTGKDYTINETHWIGGQLEQWTYTVTGDVKTSGTGGQITGATLTTTDGHTFTTTDVGNGRTGATVTFTGLPRTVAGSTKVANYTITATAYAGTTIMGYSAPSKAVNDWKTDGDNGHQVTVKSGESSGRFTIFVEETKKQLTLTDGHNSGDDKPVSPQIAATATSTHTETGIWRNYGDLGWGETVTLTNTGNTPLDVTLTITKTKGSTTTVYSGTATGGAVNDGVVNITGLNQLEAGTGKITLAKDASLNFPFTVIKDTLNWDEGDTYTFTFSSKDARAGHMTEDGPTAIYKYVMVINPVHITSVTTKDKDGTYEVTDFTIAEANGKDDLTVATKSANDATPSTTGDLVYTWYVAPWNAKVEMRNGVPYYTNDAVNPAAKRGQPLDKGQGTFADNGTKYTPHVDERGMALYLVLQGQNNATDFAVTPDITKSEPVVLVPYQGKIIIREEDVQLTDETEAANYTVVLRRKNAPAGTPDIATKWDTNAFVTDFSKESDQLWARDPNDNTSAAWEYEVWASRVKGNGTLQNTGLTITVGTKTQTVDFYKVSIDPTHVTQNRYDSPTFTPAAGSALFLTDATLLDANKQPTAKTTDGAIAVPDDGYVQKGNNVTFTYPNWEKDYTLTWGGAVSGTAQPGAARESNRTYSTKNTPAVTTTLDLNLYPMVARVEGPVGWVKHITMAIENFTFTTKSGEPAGGIEGLNDASKTLVAGNNADKRILVGQRVTFLLPKSTDTVKYTVDAIVESELNCGAVSWNYIYGATTTTDYTDHPASHPLSNVAVTGVSTTDTYTVNLKGNGLSMRLDENSLPTKMTTTVTPADGTASIPDGMAAQDGTATQEIYLPYNYGQYGEAQTVTMTIANGDNTRHIFNVRRTTSNASDGKIKAGGFDTVDEMVGKTQTGTSSQAMTVTIDPGLTVNAPNDPYTYTAEFFFDDSAGGSGKSAKITYTLEINIVPLPFDTVTTTTTDGVHSVGDYTVKVPTHGNSWTNDSESRLEYGATKDYLYQWVRADLGVTPVVSWSAGTLTVVDGSGNDLKIGGAINSTYTPTTADEGKALYLVIYATNGHNAKDFAISDAITMGYTGKIKINLNGSDLSGVTANPGYTVMFVPASAPNDSTKYVEGKWNENDGYTATLSPEEDYYTVKVSAFRGAAVATNMIDLEDVNGLVKITNDHSTDTAYYRTVNSKPFMQKDYIDNTTGENIPGAAKAITMSVGGETLNSGTPVLRGQSVLAVTGACADKDYTRTWQSSTVANDVSAVAMTADKATAGLIHTETVGSESNAQIYIGGRLKQNTYTFTGRIKSSEGATKGQVKSVTLYFQHGDDDTRNFSLTATATPNTGDHVFVDGTSDTIANGVGDTVTFTVVKGAYRIVAMEGDNTVITKVTLGVDDVVKPGELPTSTPWATRNEVTMTQDQAVTGNGRIFNIYVEERALRLKVADDDGHNATSSTATAADDNKQATHAQVYYFSGVDTKDVPLTLTNESNTNLSVSAAFTSVSSLAGVDFAAGNVGSAPGSGDKVTQTGLDFTNVAMAKDDVKTNIGKLNAVANAANNDDKIFIVRFTSKTTDTNGTDIDGPTVYYVFDLTIDPLPIVKVNKPTVDTNTGVLSVTDAGVTGVTVSHGATAADQSAANDKGLKETSDILYVWVKAPHGTSVPKTSFTLADGADIALSATAPTGVAFVTSVSASTRSYTPKAEEQGMDFYLLAVRNKANTSNAADFAISEPVYAKVDVFLKAYRTGTSTELTRVQIWQADTPANASNGGKAVVTGENGGSVDFTADKNVYLHGEPAGTADDSSRAEYYFHHWAVKLLSGAEIDKDHASVTTPVNSDRLQMTYDVTGQATVIGYYDLLPTLGGSTGYNTGSTAYDSGNDTTAEKKARTLEYTTHDGSGNVEIWIRPTGTSKFANDTTAPIKIAIMDEVFDEYPATGADGQYVLKKTWITNGPMVEESGYEFVFYDLTKGVGKNVANNDGYEGYDRVQPFRPVGGEKTVYAQVEEKDGSYHGEVQVTKGSGPDGIKGQTSHQATNGGQVTVTAYPDDGWKFKGWKLVEPDGGGYFGPDEIAAPTTSTNKSDSFNAKKLEVWVEASFELADFSATDNAKAAIYYGDDDWDGTADEITVTGDSDPSVVQSFELKLPDYTNTTEAAALLKFLTDNGHPDPAGTVAKAAKKPAWLELTEKTVDGKVVGATFSVNGNATGTNVVKDATDEVVAYVKITETNATDLENGIENIRYVPYTVDVKTSTLKIVTAGTVANPDDASAQQVADGNAYRALYHYGDGGYAGEGKDIANGEDVLFEYFNYINVQNTRNETDFADGNDSGNGHPAYAAGANRDRTNKNTYGHVDNGYWTVEDDTFNGTGETEYVEGEDKTNAHLYKFTYHYTGAGTTDDDLNYEKETVIYLRIPVLVPSLSLKFGDTMTPTEVNKPFDVRPATVDRDTEKGWGPYSPYSTAAENLTTSGAPLKLNLANDAWRNGEHITYLDNEPVYEVVLQKIGTMYNATLTEDVENTAGFVVVDENGSPTTLPTINDKTGEIKFTVKLAALDAETNLWAGEHKISFTATGYPKADGTGTPVTATYTLVVHVDPKVIPYVNVTLEEPVSGKAPDKTPDIDEEWTTPDAKGNTPIDPKDVTVEWKDKDGNPVTEFKEDNYTVTVTVPTDPNYIYASDDDTTEDVSEDIVDNTTLNGSENGEDGTEVEVNDEHTVVTIEKPMKAPITIGADFGGFNQSDAGKPVGDYKPTSKDDERYPIAGEKTYGTDWYWATNEEPDTPLEFDATLEGGKTYVLTVTLAPDEAYKLVEFVVGHKDLAKFNNTWLEDKLDLTGLTEGVTKNDDGTYTLRYHFIVPRPPTPTPAPDCPCKVFYWLGLNGTTADSTIEDVTQGNKPAGVPAVNAVEGYKFLGWSLTLPKEGEEPVLVDPATVRVTDDTTFYAVYEEVAKPVILHHTNYIVGFPDGTFKPTADITRAQVATIIARAVLPDFVEGADYGNIGGYTDVAGHWAQSAIAYCSKYGVFKGYEDDTFRPNRPISRQELALVVARLDGVEPADGTLPFEDAADVSGWALDGVYAAYTRGLVVGYEDNTFKPLDNIHRDETVTIFNRYLKRGVDAEGLSDLKDYLYGGEFLGGDDHYMVWPDVPKSRWSYYEVVEASNDHEFRYVGEDEQNPPEHWDRCWIDGTWDDGSKDIRATATSIVSSALRLSVPTLGTEAQGQADPAVFAGMIRPPVWVSKDMEVWF